MAEGLSKSYGSLEIFTDVDLAIDKGSRVVILGLNGAGKTTLLRLLGGVEKPDTGQVIEGHGLSSATTRRSTRPSTRSAPSWRTCAPPTPTSTSSRSAKTLGSFLFSGDDVDKPAGVLSGGEKTRLALATLVVSSANVLLLDEPTNNLDPASREEILGALRTYKGAVVLVTHDEGAVEALQPERIIPAFGRRRGPVGRRLRGSRRPGLIEWMIHGYGSFGRSVIHHLCEISPITRCVLSMSRPDPRRRGSGRDTF